MEDARMSDSSLFDDDFDLDFEDESRGGGAATVAPARAAKAPKAKRSGGYKPVRMRTAPNWTRIGTALGVAAVVLFILGFAVQSVRHHAKVSAYRTYFDDVKHISAQSTAIGDELNGLLSTPSGSDRALLIARIDKLATRSRKLEGQARALDAPKAMAGANDCFV
jgi:hypothetical protein